MLISAIACCTGILNGNVTIDTSEGLEMHDSTKMIIIFKTMLMHKDENSRFLVSAPYFILSNQAIYAQQKLGILLIYLHILYFNLK